MLSDGGIDHEVTMVVQRLDRLTEEESRAATAQTLEVLYSLVQNMRVVMDVKATLLGSPLVCC